MFDPGRRAARIGLFVVSGLIVLSGLRALLAGGLGYWNHKGLVVFAPFAVIIGLAGMVASLMPEKDHEAPNGAGRVRLRTFFKRRRRPTQ